MSETIIFHIDMDCFFAAVEQRERPSLKGKPVIIGADPKNGEGRGVVSTCSVEARKIGIHSAMPISQAWKLCPHGVYLYPNFSLYKETSRSVMELLRSYTDKFQQVSIDEAYLDVTELVENFEQAKQLAKNIQKQVEKKEGITCSIGIGVNKLIAKIGSDYHKPAGLTLVKKGEEQDFLNPLPIRKLYGVGKQTEKKLKALGINTIGDLALFNKEVLVSKFGMYGAHLHLTSHGIGNTTVKQGAGRSSLGHERTFSEDTNDLIKVFESIESLSQSISSRLQKEQYQFKTLSIKVRFSDFTTLTRSMTFSTPTSDMATICANAWELFQEFKRKHIRLIGVRATNLEKNSGQRTLADFNTPCTSVEI